MINCLNRFALQRERRCSPRADVEWDFNAIDVDTSTSNLRGLLTESVKARGGYELVEMWLRQGARAEEGRIEVMLGSFRVGYIRPSDVARSGKMMALHPGKTMIVNARFDLDRSTSAQVRIAMPKF